MRAAIYARSATDTAIETSINDQIKNCRELIESKGWAVCEDFIRSDHSASGLSFQSREGLKSLLEAAALNPRPFDCIVMKETSRLARNLAITFKLTEQFKSFGVSLYFIAQQLDTHEDSSGIVMMMDSRDWDAHSATTNKPSRTNRRNLK
jgi:site-specific DNA recombinase